MRLTRGKDGTVFLIYLPEEGEGALPRYLSMTSYAPPAGTRLMLLGSNRAFAWEPSGTGFVARIPEGVKAPNAEAWVFAVTR